MPRASLLVVSPHLDDAALSCGRLLAAHPAPVVVTVFAGARDTWTPATAWDRMCGFGDGDDVTARRRDEDRRGLDRLGAEPVWLDHPEVEYRSGPLDDAAVVASLRDVLDEWQPEEVLIPLGLHHVDHQAAHRAARSALLAGGRNRFVAYADFYHLSHPDELAPRLTELAADGTDLRPAELPAGPLRAKQRAVKAYRSQARGLGRGLHRWASRPPERFWQVTASPAATAS